MPKIEFELFKVWDNGGKTIDRYTVKIGKYLWGMSNDPMSPAGLIKYCGEMEEGKFHPNRWGKPVAVNTFQTLPVEVQKAILSLLNYNLCQFGKLVNNLAFPERIIHSCPDITNISTEKPNSKEDKNARRKS